MTHERATILPPPPPPWIAMRARCAVLRVRLAAALRRLVGRLVDRAERSAEALSCQLFERPSALVTSVASRADRPTMIEASRR